MVFAWLGKHFSNLGGKCVIFATLILFSRPVFFFSTFKQTVVKAALENKQVTRQIQMTETIMLTDGREQIASSCACRKSIPA